MVRPKTKGTSKKNTAISIKSTKSTKKSLTKSRQSAQMSIQDSLLNQSKRKSTLTENNGQRRHQKGSSVLSRSQPFDTENQVEASEYEYCSSTDSSKRKRSNVNDRSGIKSKKRRKGSEAYCVYRIPASVTGRWKPMSAATLGYFRELMDYHKRFVLANVKSRDYNMVQAALTNIQTCALDRLEATKAPAPPSYSYNHVVKVKRFLEASLEENTARLEKLEKEIQHQEKVFELLEEEAANLEDT